VAFKKKSKDEDVTDKRSSGGGGGNVATVVDSREMASSAPAQPFSNSDTTPDSIDAMNIAALSG
jgi:hypothetical protein